MKKYAILVLVVIIATVFATRELFPRRIVERHVIPRIVTQYDTVTALPKWFAESTKVWKKRKYTTDTLPLIVSTSLIASDIPVIPVDSPPEARPDIWPLLTYVGGAKFGDTAVVSTYSIRSGNMAISRVFIPGVLIGIDAFRDGGETRYNFAPFPEPKKPSFLYKLKMMGLGVVVVGGTAAIISLGAKAIP